MAVRIEARFLLGTYQGHRADGSADGLPDPARLHAALVAAAGLGPRAVAIGGELTPSPNDQSALRWLETNPPHRILYPDHRKVAVGDRVAYRHEGVIVKEVGVVKDKVVGRSHSDATALAGPVVWIWPSMPSVVLESLGQLCSEVPCLGETTSPVQLVVAAGAESPTDTRDTHQALVLDADQESLDPGVVDIRVPHVGRTTALIDAHLASRSGPPRPRQDGHAWTAYPAPSILPKAGLRFAAYVPEAPVAPELPWSRAVLIPMVPGRGVRDIPEEGRVAFAVSVHRALIARIGTGAVPTITGVYNDSEARRPPNRLGIQYLSPSVTALMDLPGDVRPGHLLALLLPANCDPTAEEQIRQALQGWRHVRYSGRDLPLEVEKTFGLSADQFWRAPAAGTLRRWVTVTPAVPETRPQTLPDGKRWTLADAVAVSAGLLWRDRLDETRRKRGPELFAHLRQVVRGQGFKVRDLVPITGRPVRNYVHATPENLVIQPYRALLDMGDLLPDSGVVAIGQSRHLGGGLLIPLDLPRAIVDSGWETSRW